MPVGVYERTEWHRERLRSQRRRVTPAAERLWRRVDKTPGCWNWTGAVNAWGYGVIGRGRTGEGNVCVHVLAYETEVGPVPEGWEVDHLCFNRICVNPEHLEAVTKDENIRRANVRKGSHAE